MGALWGLVVTYLGVSVAILVVIQRRAPGDATAERRRANGRIVVGLALLGTVLSVGIALYFVA